MGNYTYLPEFHIVSVFTSTHKSYFFNLFIFLYLTGLLANSVIITVIFLDKHLHTPMYLFLCNLSFIDLCYTTVTVPKLLYMLLSGNHQVSFIQCITQMYYFYGFAGTEIVLLSMMAYDRYVAICKPLHYHRIFSWKHCVQLTVAIWVAGYLNSLLIVLPTTKISFYYSYTIHQYFCDAKSLKNIASTNKELFFIVIYAEVFILGYCPFLCSLMSYIKIIITILKIKSSDGRRKAFSTCSSHLTVLTIFYGSCTSLYMMPQSERYKILDMIFSLLYTAVTPMLNPLIYSLQNTDVKMALKRFVWGKIKQNDTK
ncbi:olfactory receptor 1E16-like [Mixophyes fleayi]|uniref:olfactory receptor 1E16-like n=1 Tax=Mixophyes fleayi TaxID=3061075 RepID=UPI003F4E4362